MGEKFFLVVRTRGTVVEDPGFGFRAAGAASLMNLSVERRSVVGWNPEEMKVLLAPAWAGSTPAQGW